MNSMSPNSLTHDEVQSCHIKHCITATIPDSCIQEILLLSIQAFSLALLLTLVSILESAAVLPPHHTHRLTMNSWTINSSKTL